MHAHFNKICTWFLTLQRRTFNQEPWKRWGWKLQYVIQYIVSKPPQRRPVNLNGTLLSAPFKKALLMLLKNEWISDNYAATLEGHKVYFASEESCYLYMAKDGHVE